MVPSSNGETTSMISPPSGTALGVGKCGLSIASKRTQEVLESPATHGWVFVYDVHTNDMCLDVLVSKTR